MNCWSKNLAALQENQPELLKIVNNYRGTSDRVEVLKTKSGQQTIKIKVTEKNHVKTLLLHSLYNPVLEGRKFAEEIMSRQKEKNIIFGFGMGYHIESMCNLLSHDNKLLVFDTNLDVFIETLKYRDISEILQNRNVIMYISDDSCFLANILARMLQENPDLNICTHVPSVNAMREEDEELKYVLLEINLRKSINDEYLDLLERNYQKNKLNINKNVGIFFDEFKNMPVIIVAAGPSLDKNKHLLKELNDKAIIICVGESLKTLININVFPHFIITIDPNEITYKQIEGLEDSNVPFILLDTAAGINAEMYQGPKFMACQYKNHLVSGEENYLIKTGGSVSTTALDIAIRMGGNPIIFIGQDLAYTGNASHCEDSTFGSTKVLPANLRKVRGWHGQMLPTTLGMLSFNRWIANRVAGEGNTLFINATEGGAFIEGLKHMPLKEAATRYLNKQFDFKEIIKTRFCQ